MSRSRLPITRLAFSVAACWLLCCTGCGRGGDALATVEGHDLSRAQFEVFRQKHPLSGETPAAALGRAVDREVAFALAEREGLMTGGGWKKQTQETEEQVLAEAYLATLPPPAPFTEAEAEQFFRAHKEERQVEHILATTREEADLLKARLKNGENLETLATHYSKDPTARENRGQLGWIRRGQTVPPFEEAVFGAKVGEWVGPFKSDYGWHVARVLAERGPQPGEFAASKAAVMSGMEAKRQDRRREDALVPLRARFPLQSDQEVLDLDRTTETGPGDQERTAGTVAGHRISLSDLKQYLGETMRVSGQGHSLGPAIKTQYMELLADGFRLAAAAREAKLDQSPEVQIQVWDAQREAALVLYRQAFLKKVQVSEADLRAHHESHPDRFQGPGEVRLLVLTAPDESSAQQALAEAVRGTAWDELVTRFADREATGEWDLGWVPFASLQKALGAPALEALRTQPENRPLGPFRGPAGYDLFEVLGRKPGAPLAFDYCREAVRADYIRERGDALLAAHLRGEGRRGLSVRVSAPGGEEGR